MSSESIVSLPVHSNCTIAVIGLGYVGLPLAIEFAKVSVCRKSGLSLNRNIIGFDINVQRITQLREFVDCTREVSLFDLQLLSNHTLTCDASLLANADVFIVTVPTPIDRSRRPDLHPLKAACRTVGNALKLRSGSCTPIVIFESTVFPSATEDICVPLIEEFSGLSYNLDFFCGYSPERINPGDNNRKLSSIVKVTSGSSPVAADWVNEFYSSIISAGTYSAPSIKIAEAAKVIENTQRDLNIALVNELAIIFQKFGIDTHDVLDAASTKWNFLPFRPGLVGGHCIGVDPYYLTYKSEELGYLPEVVLAGRRINDGMPMWISQQLVLAIAKSGLPIVNSRVLILGFTFKENCCDIRNTKVFDLVNGLRLYGMNVDIVDPWVDSFEANSVYQLDILPTPPEGIVYDAVILAVAHHQFSSFPTDYWSSLLKSEAILFDLKGIVPRGLNPLRL